MKTKIINLYVGPCSGNAPPDPENLLRVLRTTPRKMTPAEQRELRISWAYGQSKFRNPDLTRADVAATHDRLYGPDGKRKDLC